MIRNRRVLETPCGSVYCNCMQMLVWTGSGHRVNSGLLTLSNKRELKSAPLGLRITPTLKEALEKAAKADSRSVASMAEIILTQWLEQHGHLMLGDE